MEHLKRPHAICIPFPAQGHINPILKLAKLLHSAGFYITFVHTQFTYDRLHKSQDPASLTGVADFLFETISDGLPESCQRGILDLPGLVGSLPIHGLQSFRDLLKRLNACPEVPPVSCIVSDGVMSFTLEVAQEFGIPEILFFTPSACGMLGYFHLGELVERGFFPLKDEGCFSNGFLNTKICWIPAMEGIRLKDLPTFLRSSNPEDAMFNYNVEQVNNLMKTRSLILNTFDDLEQQVLDAIRLKIPNLYTVGPLSRLQQQFASHQNQAKLDSIDSSLWKEDGKFLQWLDRREPRSVVYVNYGSLVIMSPQQLSEFARGLANSKYPFLWIIRPDLVDGGPEVISDDFLEEIKDRGMLLRWCSQEEVLGHPSIGGFLTHCGWNSILESISEGVPMNCWPFFAEQQTNCFYLCNKWGIGMEIDSDVKREQVEGLLRELMEGVKGQEIREGLGMEKES